jgi:four helix bundle protein
MPRDYRKLRTFQYADDLAVDIYKITRKFPKEEIFGLTSQMRRSAVSIPANIVEGSYRSSEAEYLNFLNIAMGSGGELGYYLSLSEKLGYLNSSDTRPLQAKHDICIKSLNALISAIRGK